jgi:hypothetical protein
MIVAMDPVQLNGAPRLWFRDEWSWDGQANRPILHQQTGDLRPASEGLTAEHRFKIPEGNFCVADQSSIRVAPRP